MKQSISRRQAIKDIAVAGAGIAAGVVLLESFRTPVKSEIPKKEAPEGSRIVSRTWKQLDGDKVGLLGLGMMRLPKKEGAGNGFTAPLDQEKVNEMVDYALAHGINYFDTAPAYGESEKVSGIALSRYPRNSYYLATKCSNMSRGGGAPKYEDAVKMFETSLANLKTDYIDYLLLHNLGSYAQFESRFLKNGVLKYFQQKKEEGVIRHLGFSYHGDNENFVRILDYPDVKWEFCQIQMNYLDWKKMSVWGGGDVELSSEFLYNAAAERNIPLTIMEPIRGGALATVNDGIKSLMNERLPGLSPAGVALSFVASYPNVLCTLSGMSNMDQLVENVETFTDFKPVSEEDRLWLATTVCDAYNNNAHIPCTTCSYCMPCPSGVNIPGNFLAFNTTSDELNIPDPEMKGTKEYKKKRKIFLARYNALAEGSRADACTKCNVCLRKCPQSIRIPQQLEMIRTLVEKLG